MLTLGGCGSKSDCECEQLSIDYAYVSATHDFDYNNFDIGDYEDCFERYLEDERRGEKSGLNIGIWGTPNGWFNYLCEHSDVLLSFGGYTTQEIKSESQGTIIESISETLDISSSNITVKDYTLVQESDNVYSGILMTEYEDMTQTWDIKVVWDHNTDEYTVEWEIENEK